MSSPPRPVVGIRHGARDQYRHSFNIQPNSAQARLTVLQSPDISGITVNHADVSVSFPSVAGLNYTLEYKNLLTDPSWVVLSPSTPGTGSPLTLHDTNTPPALRFYRILCD